MTRMTLVVAAATVLGAGGLIAARHDEKHEAVRTLAAKGLVATNRRAGTRVLAIDRWNLLDRDVFKVNLIPYNPTGIYDGSSREAIARFKAVLDGARLPSTVRLTRGRDIAAACGQLASGRAVAA